MCRNFVELLYLNSSEEESSLGQPTTKFDDCGFLGGATGVQIPSQIYSNVYDFLQDDSLKPAFFKDYYFEISDDPIDNRTCFNEAALLKTSVLVASAIALTSLY